MAFSGPRRQELHTLSSGQLGKELGSQENLPNNTAKVKHQVRRSFILGGPVLKLKTDKHVWESERLTQKSPGPWLYHYVKAIDPTSELALIFFALP